MNQPYGIDFNLLNSIFQYLICNDGYLPIKVNGQMDTVEASWYQIPSSCSGEKNLLKKHKFKNFYELVNTISARSDLGTLDINKALEADTQVNLMEISFHMLPAKGEDDEERTMRVNFFFMLVDEPEIDTLGGFRTYYIRSNEYMAIANYFNAKYIPHINKSEIADVKALERNLAALSEYIGSPAPQFAGKYEQLLPGPATVEDFERIINLVNYHPLQEDIAKKAKNLFAAFQKKWDEDAYTYFPRNIEVIDEENVWNSDWKFEAKEIEEVIATLLKKDWTFERPSKVYSHNLFPYIQTELQKQGLELMTFDTEEDAYEFFLIQKKDVAEILNLSNKLSLGIEQLPM